MTHQTSFARAEFAAKKKTTRREKFLERMEEVIPWSKLLTVIEPHYPKGRRGRPPISGGYEAISQDHKRLLETGR